MSALVQADDYSAAEAERAIATARGRCRTCRARAIDTVRRRNGMGGTLDDLARNWARYDFVNGGWLDSDDRKLAPHELEPRDEIVDLRVVRVADTAPSLYAGRVLVLCQLCTAVLNAPPTGPSAEPLELPL